MRRFVVIGRKASASPDFSLVDLAGTSGRLDVLLRCLRASMLVSHGLRRDVSVYLVLLGGVGAPRTLRIRGDEVRFLRPDERSLAVLAKKALSEPVDGHGFCAVRPGVAVANDGLGAVLEDLGPGTPYLVEEGSGDIRSAPLDLAAPVFFVGDHGGFEAAFLAQLAALQPMGVSVGPVSVHAEDAIALVSNELDRREHSQRWPTG